MTLEEYEQGGQTLYADFAGVVAAIIEACLRANPTIRRQPIQTRAKTPESLKAKLDKAGYAAIGENVKDLAGVRIVVYSNSDVERLSQSRILFENFDVVWKRTKLHYPRDGEAADESQFIGDNYVVRLKESRAVLPEYSRFAGLLCEVQVQTILNHAWSETAHDTIYKSPKLDGVGAAQLRKIKERMKHIQQKYLLPAGYEFQQVLNDFDHIASGQRLVDGKILSAIHDAADNNVRVELLDQYETQVLPVIDDVPSVAPDIRRVLLDAVENALAAPVAPIETPYGNFRGHDLGDVVDKTLSILNTLRYVEPAESYRAFADLFLLLKDREPRKKVVDAVRELAQYTLPVWRGHGPTVQEILLDAIAATPPERLATTRPLMIEIAGQCLGPDVTGTSSTSSTFTWETGAVTVSNKLNIVRDRAFALLQDLLVSSQSDLERRQIFNALKNATRLPSQGQYADALMLRAFRDSEALIRFLTDILAELSDPFRVSIEEDVFFLYRRCRDLPAAALKDATVLAARDAVMMSALAFRDRLHAIKDYITFKTLVGLEAVFSYEWGEDVAAADFEAKARYRKERCTELLADVNDATADFWFDRLNSYAAIESDDSATFAHLGHFITDVAQAHPTIGKAWLERSRNQPLSKFTPGLLQGLYASDATAAAQWADAALDRDDENVSGIAMFLRHAEPVLPALLEKAARRAVTTEGGAAYIILEAVAARPAEFGLPLARRMLVEMVGHLQARGRYRWTDPLWTWGKRQGLLLQLDDGERARLFASLRDLPRIDFRAEEILAIFAETQLVEIIDLFGERLAREREDDVEPFSDKKFEAIPFGFIRLNRSMPGAAALALPRAFEWYRRDVYLAEFKSARFIANLFPEPPDDLVRLLIEYATSKERERQDFVIAITKNYKGAAIVYTVLRELVAIVHVDDPLLRSVRVALGETGVMHGEFGHRDILIAQQSALEPWLSDQREPVRRFADDLRTSLDNEVAAAQRRAEADIAMRKLTYGEEL